MAFEEGEEVKHFNANDLENGNTAKGILTGIGPGDGDWRLELTSGLVFTAPVHMRTRRDGFLTSLHDTVPGDEDGAHRVHIFNPGSDTRQRSILRIVNPSAAAVSATIAGTDDRGNEGRSTVTARIAANAATELTAQELETMGLGDGAGKRRLRVTANRPLLVMSLMATPTGHLTNLSTAPETGASLVPLLPASSGNRQGFVRIINETDTEQTVVFRAFDDAAMERGTVRLSVGANEAMHLRLDNGSYYKMRDALNTGKGLMATAALRRQSGAIVPNRDVYKCGDFMEHCFTVPDIGHTSGATAKLSAMAFHPFQLYENAAEAVRVLKHCAQDVGAPGIDREFGQGLVDLRCSEAMLPVIER